MATKTHFLNESQIEDDLTSTDSTKVLSAKQGKVLNDKFSNYLPLSGGTMSGTIIFSTADVIKRSVNSSSLCIFSGMQDSDGGWITLRGRYNSWHPGSFLLVARSGSTATELEGFPNGTLAWGGKNVITKSYNDVTITGIDVTIGVMDHYDCFEIGGVVNINACMKIDTAVSATTHFLKFSKTPIRSMSITLNKLTNTPQANRLVIETSGEGYFYDMNLAAGDWIQITGTYRTND